jgi:hypothetical protein
MSYNGWTNYQTWKVNLEFFDGMSSQEFYSDNVENLASEMESMVEEYIDENTTGGLIYSWALDAIREVNWFEIAEHYVEEE